MGQTISLNKIALSNISVAIKNILAKRGKVYHYKKLTKEIREEYPKRFSGLKYTKVLAVLSKNRNLFERVDVGTYWIRGFSIEVHSELVEDFVM